MKGATGIMSKITYDGKNNLTFSTTSHVSDLAMMNREMPMLLEVTYRSEDEKSPIFSCEYIEDLSKSGSLEQSLEVVLNNLGNRKTTSIIKIDPKMMNIFHVANSSVNAQLSRDVLDIMVNKANIEKLLHREVNTVVALIENDNTRGQEVVTKLKFEFIGSIKIGCMENLRLYIKDVK